MNDNVLSVEDLSVRFGDAVVLDRLGFDVPRGTSLAVIGPNGAGKTVLFKALIGAISYEGRVRWSDGTRIGYVPQKLDIERDLPVSGDDLLRAKAAVTGARRGEVARAVDAVGLSGAVCARPIGTLAGGQFQRLLVAVALVGDPTVLMLDEPTAGVDEPGQERISATIERLRRERGLTTLEISHDLTLVYRRASNVLCIARGTACVGAPTTVLTPARLEELYGAPVAYHAHDLPRS